MKKKERLDITVFEKRFAPSREKAKAVIMSGVVYVDGIRSDKPGTMVAVDSVVEIRGKTLPFVSRGGLKLKKALEVFAISPQGKVCMDVGASTGGFTDCMLQNGALKVYAVDVGYGQLDYRLRINPKVISLERTNIRYLEREKVPDRIEFASIDVSFISLKLVLPVLSGFLERGAELVCLIKPQFEAGRELVGKNGVVRDEWVHKSVVRDIMGFCRENGFRVKDFTFSPIKGPRGNIEYLMCLRKEENCVCDTNINIEGVVEDSHRELD